jgi:hypothetical protein
LPSFEADSDEADSEQHVYLQERIFYVSHSIFRWEMLQQMLIFYRITDQKRRTSLTNFPGVERVYSDSKRTPKFHVDPGTFLLFDLLGILLAMPVVAGILMARDGHGSVQ